MTSRVFALGAGRPPAETIYSLIHPPRGHNPFDLAYAF